jgi:NAD(P)-dependent dehydrogenase (short-subunit alcohol dehydrogenase family)/Tfp pilus assembly protein PilF
MDNQKVILITGCSSGFGLLTAVRLAARGHLVWATMRDLSKKSSLESAIFPVPSTSQGFNLAQRQTQVFIRELDVTKPSTIKNVIEEIQKTHGRVDVLINNAGYGIGGFFEDLSEKEIRSQMEVNFFGVQSVCREVIPLMRKHRQGKIINISSIAGRVASPCLGAYNVSKWALEAFSESLYFELALFGISVVLVEPGSYPTDIFTKNAHYAKDFDNAQSPYFLFSQRLKDLSQKTIKKLKKDPDDVAKLIENIVNKSHPRLRYVSDFSSWARTMLQRILPACLMSRIFKKIIISALFLSVPSVFAQTVKGYNEQGLTYLKQGNLKAAITEFTKAIEADHTNAAGYINRALALAQVDDLTGAVSDSTQAIEIDPKNAVAYYLRGTIYYDQGDLIPAILDFSQDIAINPKVAKGYMSRALVYLRDNDPDKAIPDLTKVLELNPKYIRAYYNLAVGYYQLKQYDKAWDYLKKAQDLGVKPSPDFIAALKQASGK